ncbi:Hypothetical protein EAG7_00546 [Klebsiella aerogenes]|nr:Hypothetical protein EAG7_00546 [Klebsiella aerogenes]
MFFCIKHADYFIFFIIMQLRIHAVAVVISCRMGKESIK